MKFADKHGRIATVKADQAQARQCYIHSLEVNANLTEQGGQPKKEDGSKKEAAEEKRCREKSKGKEKVGSPFMLTELDMREEVADMHPQPDGNLEDFQIGSRPEQTTRIEADLPEPVKSKIKAVLQENKDLFAWTTADMPGIDPNFICHRLSITEGSKSVAQRKRKMGPERQKEIEKQVNDLFEAGFVREVSYTTWLENVVLVKKASGKWRMCVDYTDLNKACPKDPYPLPNIDRLVDGSSRHKFLSFMDAYSSYNQIPMHPKNQSKTAFITETAI